jgi:hypothetical protein
MIKALALTSHKHLELIPNPTPLPLTQLCHARTLVHVREYVWTICTLVSSTFVAPFSETIKVFYLFHLLAKVNLPSFIDDFHLKMEVILNWEAFVFTVAHSPWFSSDGLSSMVYELLWDCFVPNDFANGFELFFEVCEHIAWGHVPASILCLYSTFQLLTLEKQSKSTCPIIINEVWPIT